MMTKELPKNWVNVNLKTVLDYKKGKKPKKLSELEFEDSVPYLDIKAFEKNEIRRYADPKSSNLIYPNQLGIVWDGARSGWVTKGKYGAVGSTIAILKPKIVNEVFTFHFLKSKFDYINSNTRGTGIPHVDPQILWSIDFPLPPLAEQQRIVAKLDALFARLDTIKASLVNIPQLLQNFRQQVLTQAVTGKLTEEWREGKKFKRLIEEQRNLNYQLHQLPLEWSHTITGGISKVKGGKRLPKGESLVSDDTGLPYIRARDLKRGSVLTENMMYLTEEVQEKIKRYIVKEGDLYITIVGAKIGDAGMIPPEMNNANLTENAAKITELVEDVYNKYVSLWLRSPISQKNIQDTIMSAAQGKLALTRIKQLPIYIPPLKEQQEIVHRVEKLFKKADKIQEQYVTLSAKIEQLPQAILHKAFKGELVPQLESDGDAKDLLKEIEALKLAGEPKKKRK